MIMRAGEVANFIILCTAEIQLRYRRHRTEDFNAMEPTTSQKKASHLGHLQSPWSKISMKSSRAFRRSVPSTCSITRGARMTLRVLLLKGQLLGVALKFRAGLCAWLNQPCHPDALRERS